MCTCARVQNGDNMLSLAVMMGQTDVVRVLLQDGRVNVNETSGEVDWTPLAAASRYGYYDAAKLLIDNKANVNSKDKWGNSNLVLAAYGNHLEIAKYLIQCNAEVNANNDVRR